EHERAETNARGRRTPPRAANKMLPQRSPRSSAGRARMRVTGRGVGSTGSGGGAGGSNSSTSSTLKAAGLRLFVLVMRGGLRLAPRWRDQVEYLGMARSPRKGAVLGSAGGSARNAFPLPRSASP